MHVSTSMRACMQLLSEQVPAACCARVRTAKAWCARVTTDIVRPMCAPVGSSAVPAALPTPAHKMNQTDMSPTHARAAAHAVWAQATSRPSPSMKTTAGHLFNAYFHDGIDSAVKSKQP